MVDIRRIYWQQEGDEQEVPPYRHLSVRYIAAARAEHRCTGCGGAIPVGASYERRTHLIDHEFIVDKECEGCIAERTRYVSPRAAERM